MSQQQNIETIHRLSPMQEGLLFHSLEGSRSGVYFNQFTCVFDGPVDIARFKTAWDRAAERHPVLRSLITWERRDHPLQVVRRQVTLPWTQIDWRNCAAEEQEGLWRDFLAQDRAKGFDLAQAPIMRFALAQVAEDRTRFLWSFHHILLDGWSLLLVLEEVLRIYHQGERAPALDAVVPYSDFIAWLGKEDCKAAEMFWTETLKDFDGPTPLPMAQATMESNTETKVLTLTLSAKLTGRLVSIARENRLTLNSLLVGAWSILLGRYAGQDDIVLGTTISGRTIDLDSADQIVGLLLNTLPLRVRIQPKQRLSEWLRDVQSHQLNLRAYEQTPLSAIQRWSGMPAGRGLFETVLVFQSFPSRNDAWKSELEFQIIDEEFIEWSNYPLALLVFPGERLALTLVYDNKRFDETVPGRLLDQLETLLAGMADDLARPLSKLSMMPKCERQLVLETWNETQQPYPNDVSIQALIEPWAKQRPEAIAVASETEELTYVELDRKAKGLARRLKGRGIGKDTPVPIFMERSADAIVAMLGVIYAGGAYVPLDPTYPEQRVHQVLEDVGAAVALSGGRLLVLTQTHLKEQLSSGDFDVMALDHMSIVEGPDDAGETLVPAAPQDLAYIIHTSGSTGRPKGVMVSHRNLVNSTHARVGAYPDDVESFLLLSSIATDSSVAGVFWALSRGATLVLPRGRQEQDIQQLVALIERRRVTHTLCVPSLYRVILESGDPAGLASFHAVILAGEACGAELVRRHYQLLPTATLYNEYGPTEGTVWASLARLESDRPVTIGRPIANVTLYVLDENRQPVPVGLPGELYIGGAGVARGYLNQPEETERRFVPDPFGPDRGAKLYRTGDRVRHTAEGEIEYLGRVDNQIKVRGFRVEPEEIERSLTEHPAVHEAVVVLNHAGARQGNVAEDPAALHDALSRLTPAEAERLLAELERSAERRGDLDHRSVT